MKEVKSMGRNRARAGGNEVGMGEKKSEIK